MQSKASPDPGACDDPLLSWRQRFEHWSPGLVMGVALGLSLLVALALRLLWGSGVAFLPFFPAVVFCALVSGWRHALAATVISTLLAAGFYPGRIDAGFFAALAVYLLGNALLIVLAESARRAIARAEARAAAAQESERRIRALADSVPRVGPRGEAEPASRARDEFLAMLSHELRTPLSVILLRSRILARKYATEEGELRKGLALIIDNGLALSTLLGDLPEMSRIVAGRVTLDLRPVDAVELVNQAVASHRPAAEARQVEIETDIGPGARIVLADPTRLQQVLWNLLSNAVKSTPERGHVRVGVHRRGSLLEIAVHDDGEGIEGEVLTQVPDRFRHADSGSSRRHGDLGLGLAIVKQLVELHGGQVRAESAGPGRGANFVVTLPLHE